MITFGTYFGVVVVVVVVVVIVVVVVVVAVDESAVNAHSLAVGAGCTFHRQTRKVIKRL